jgi:hypothetical protein
MVSKDKIRIHEGAPTKRRKELTPIPPDDRIVGQKVDVSVREQ